MRHSLWLVIHHAVAHPLMLVLPRAWGDALHDWTAARAWARTGFTDK